nr:hypothetical protein [Candidatus Sigynarchaeota archaeon]
MMTVSVEAIPSDMKGTNYIVAFAEGDLGTHAFFYNIRKDEFEILCSFCDNDVSEEMVDTFIQRIKSNMEKYVQTLF